MKNQSLALGLDYTLTSTPILDVRFGWFKYRVDVLPATSGPRPPHDAGIPGLNLGDAFTSGLPLRANIEGNQASSASAPASDVGRCNCPLAQDEKQCQIAPTSRRSWAAPHAQGRDRHPPRQNLRVPSDSHRAGELKFHAQPHERARRAAASGLATFLLGDVTFFKRYVSPTTDARERQWRSFYYVQDTWRPSNKLTLN